MESFRADRRAFIASVLTMLHPGCNESAEEPLRAQSYAVETPRNGFLGIQFKSIDTTPLVVTDIVPNSHARQTDIRPGDVLYKLGTVIHPSMNDIFRLLEDTVPGDTMEIIVKRNEQTLSFELVLSSFDEIQSAMELKQAMEH